MNFDDQVFATAASSNKSKDLMMDISDDISIVSLSIDSGESLFSGSYFVPPPPRPSFLEDVATPDIRTACNLCSWALHTENSIGVKNPNLGNSNGVGWIVVLVIVSLSSAILGATIMTIFFHFKRLKKSSNRNGTIKHSNLPVQVPIINVVTDPSVIDRGQRSSVNADTKVVGSSNSKEKDENINRIWNWLSCRSSPPTQLQTPSISFVENHYTDLQDNAYTSIQENVYSTLEEENSRNIAYQNSGFGSSYAVPSAPSSAYYSDLSVAGSSNTDRIYEVIGLSTMSN